MTSGGKDSNMEQPPAKKQKQNGKEFHDKYEVAETSYMNTNIFKFRSG